MLILLSPSKRLDYDSALPEHLPAPTQPRLLGETEELAKVVKKLSRGDIKKLMELSDNLAELNYERFQHFHTPFTPDNARPALLAFKGDVYDNMDVAGYSHDDFAFAQQHLRILSGFYGLLRPMDLMQPYRLEMGRKLATPRGSNLYDFWDDKITQKVKEDAKAAGGGTVINLASGEYIKAVQADSLAAPMVNIVFKQNKGGNLKTIGLMAKRARGAMADWVIKNRLTDASQLKKFALDGYRYQPTLSTEIDWVFTKKMD